MFPDGNKRVSMLAGGNGTMTKTLSEIKSKSVFVLFIYVTWFR